MKNKNKKRERVYIESLILVTKDYGIIELPMCEVFDGKLVNEFKVQKSDGTVENFMTHEILLKYLSDLLECEVIDFLHLFAQELDDSLREHINYFKNKYEGNEKN